jgi:ribonuclease Z
MREELSIRAAGIRIEGRSCAGQESYYRLPELRSGLEIGRCPQSLVAVPNLFVTHAHLDHAAGIATYASQRTLHDMPAGRVFLPEEVAAELEAIVEAHRRLERVDAYRAEIRGVAAGDRIEVRKDLAVRVFSGRHRVPTAGFTFVEVRRKLKEEFRGLPQGRIAALRAEGVEVSGAVEEPLLSYPGDSGPEIFDSSPEIFDSRVLLLDCTFLRPGEEDKARRYGHLHIVDIAARAENFRNEAIVLTHFSARYSPEEILTRLRELPPALAARVTAFIEPPEEGLSAPG